MRLMTWLFLVLVLGVCMAISRDEVGRVALIVFVTGCLVIAAGLTAILALFHTVAALGEAQTFAGHVEAIVATVVVLVVGSATLLVLGLVGSQLVAWSVP